MKARITPADTADRLAALRSGLADLDATDAALAEIIDLLRSAKSRPVADDEGEEPEGEEPEGEGDEGEEPEGEGDEGDEGDEGEGEGGEGSEGAAGGEESESESPPPAPDLTSPTPPIDERDAKLPEPPKSTPPIPLAPIPPGIGDPLSGIPQVPADRLFVDDYSAGQHPAQFPRTFGSPVAPMAVMNTIDGWVMGVDKDNAKSRAILPGVAETIATGIRAALSFRPRERERARTAQRAGRLDIGARAVPIMTGSDAVYRGPAAMSRARAQVTLLTDQSGSMATRIADASAAAAGIALGCRAVAGIDVTIAGHSLGAVPFNGIVNTGMIMTVIATPATPTPIIIRNCKAMCGDGGNADGDAIGWCARRMLAEPRHYADRIIIVLSDGQPSDVVSLRGRVVPADSTRDAIAAVRASGIRVFGIGIDHTLAGTGGGDSIYSPGMWADIGEPMESAGIIAGLLSRIAEALSL